MNTLPFPLFLTHNTKLEGIPRKIKWKIHAFLHFISSFQSASYKMIHLLVFYFLLFSISFYIQLFITSFSAIWKKISVTNFPFLEQIQPNLPPNLLKGKNQLSMAKVFFYLLYGCSTVNLGPLSTLQVLITALYLFWSEIHRKSLERKFFVESPLAGWLVKSVNPPLEPATEHHREDAWDVIGKVIVRGFFPTEWPIRVSLKNSCNEKLSKLA